MRPEEVDEAAQKRFKGLQQSNPAWWRKIQNKTVHSGVAHIMRCKNKVEVAQLLNSPDDFLARFNYNLRGYLDPVYTDTGTVEFREATGSMSGEWVSAWSNICLGFFRFAREAADDRFWAVIEELAAAEAASPGEQAYDMVSLLFDMGLFAEALFLEGKLRKDPVRFWYPNTLGPAEAAEPAETGAGPSSGSDRASPPAEYNVAGSSDDDSASPGSTPFLTTPALGDFSAPGWRPASPGTFGALGWRPAGRRTSF